MRTTTLDESRLDLRKPMRSRMRTPAVPNSGRVVSIHLSASAMILGLFCPSRAMYTARRRGRSAQGVRACRGRSVGAEEGKGCAHVLWASTNCSVHTSAIAIRQSVAALVILASASFSTRAVCVWTRGRVSGTTAAARGCGSRGRLDVRGMATEAPARGNLGERWTAAWMAWKSLHCTWQGGTQASCGMRGLLGGGAAGVGARGIT